MRKLRFGLGLGRKYWIVPVLERLSLYLEESVNLTARILRCCVKVVFLSGNSSDDRPNIFWSSSDNTKGIIAIVSKTMA